MIRDTALPYSDLLFTSPTELLPMMRDVFALERIPLVVGPCDRRTACGVPAKNRQARCRLVHDEQRGALRRRGAVWRIAVADMVRLTLPQSEVRSIL